MATVKKIKIRAWRRAQRVRTALRKSTLPRVSVFRSLNHIYAQVINDQEGVTLASCSTRELTKLKGDKKAKAHAVGLELAKRSKEKGIEVMVFDRGSFLYHGRVKALAEGLREGGVRV